MRLVNFVAHLLARASSLLRKRWRPSVPRDWSYLRFNRKTDILWQSLSECLVLLSFISPVRSAMMSDVHTKRLTNGSKEFAISRFGPVKMNQSADEAWLDANTICRQNTLFVPNMVWAVKCRMSRVTVGSAFWVPSNFSVQCAWPSVAET